MLPVQTLENEFVSLSPMKSGDWKKYGTLHEDPSLWVAFPYDLSDKASFTAWMEERVEMLKAGKWYPFVVTSKKTDSIVGMTCYLNVDEPNLALEIGGTWYGKAYQGTEVNPSSKHLLLDYAFTELGYERVEFKTDAQNTVSRKAIAKLGAKEEGTLRSNRIVQQGRRRDTVYFSILKAEWPQVKEQLEQRIGAYR